MRQLYALIAAFLFVALSGASGWLYTGSSDGPGQWGDIKDSNGNTLYPMCRDGKHQSPINFNSVGYGLQLNALNPTWGGKRVQATVTAQNNGHSIQIDLPKNAPGQDPLMFSDPNTGKSYQLIQFHFHTPSEHTFGNGFRDMEVHFVHQNADDNSLLVLGVTYIASPSAGGNRFLESFWSLLDQLPWNSTESPLPKPVQAYLSSPLTDVLPDSEDYYMYSGSLTTPPCTEGVTWYIYTEPLAMGLDALERLRRDLSPITSVVQGQLEYEPVGNHRPVQPLNDRAPLRYSGAINLGVAAATEAVQAMLTRAIVILALLVALIAFIFWIFVIRKGHCCGPIGGDGTSITTAPASSIIEVSVEMPEKTNERQEAEGKAQLNSGNGTSAQHSADASAAVSYK